jgi:tetratricopeptide (TPR) repeat protein
MTVDHGDVVASAEAARTIADLAQVLRTLRRREARLRNGPELTYQEISGRTGWSVSVIGGYFTGVKLPSTERFDELVRLLGARPQEQGVLASARERAAVARSEDDRLARSRGAPTVVPRMLPPRVAGFTGRLAQRAQLDGLLVADRPPGAVVISALDGMAGVGKTALAVHWAHDRASDFPDGQLYVNLRGYDPNEPLSTMDALGVLLRALGVEPGAVPPDLAGRVGRYHRSLSGRRMLVLLDNAGGVTHVRPLIPPAPSVAVVTSRDDLSELVTVDGARRMTLDVLREGEAVALLRLLIGERADREPAAVHTLARRCGNLPLALRVAAEHAAARPTVTLADLVAELDEASDALDAFGAAGDERADLRVVFSWSLRRLPAPATRAFHLLGLIPGSDIDVYGLAALVGVELAEAERLAQTLVSAHLLQSDGRGRLSMHDLVRAYARRSGERETPVWREALTRLLDYYRCAATAAIDVQFPLNRSVRPEGPATSTAWISTPDLRAVGSAMAWLLAERANLVSTCVHAARHGWPHHAVSIALLLRPFLDDGYVQDGLRVLTEALAAAQVLGDECDPADRASIHGCLGVTNFWSGRLEIAAEHLQHAFEENIRVGHFGGAVSNVAVLGLVREGQGRYQDALACQRRGLLTARAAGNQVQEGVQLVNLGFIHLRLEEFETAADLYRQAYAIFEQDDQLLAMGHADQGLATALEGLAHYDEALAHVEAARDIYWAFGHAIDRVRVIDTIGLIYLRLGRAEEALDCLEEALHLGLAAHNPRPTCSLLNTVGEVCLALGDHGRAVANHTEAIDRAERFGSRFERTRALVGLGDARLAQGDAFQARRHWREAHAALADMGLPAVERVRARLSGER